MPHSTDRLTQAKARVLKALGHPTRLAIAEMLGDGERCVCEIVERCDASFPTVSKHLAILREAGVVEDDKRGQQVFYRLRVPCILNFMSCVESVIQARVEDQVAMLK